jgi:hypothetical protein
MAERLGKLLNKLAERTAEAVRPGLAEDIKQQIPERLGAHRGGMDTIKIMIDLRVSKLAAAAVIIISMILLASFFRVRNSPSGGFYEDSKLLIKYALAGEQERRRADLAAAMSRFYEYLAKQGKEVVFYAESANINDSNSVLMQWKVSDGRYKVILGDLREIEVSAEELIKLQARMLQGGEK